MRYEYPGGVVEEERPLIEKFEADVLPYAMKHGPVIGEAAMKGDANATEIIRRMRLFVEGLPEMRRFNYGLLVEHLKAWEVTRT